MRRALVPALIAVLVATFPAADADAQLKATPVASGLSRPVGFIQNPADPAVQFIVEQGGRIRVRQNGVVLGTDFLDLTMQVNSDGERGLLGLAFPPDYATSRRFYVSFTNVAGHSVIARFLRSNANALQADPNTRFDLMWPDGQRLIVQPFANHNGGHIAFGPDGYLYIGLGDGGSGSDPGHRAQNPLTLLGKMLRINVSVDIDNHRGYSVPASNPFFGRDDVLNEIWSFGLRNPWRWSFDYPRAGSTGAMLIADVGQGAREEVNYEPIGAGGRNYGWRNREGTLPQVTTPGPFSTPLREPIWEYDRDTGRSITGGYVYRGSALGAAYRGRYFFADFALSRVWSIALTVDPVTREATAGSLMTHTTELGAGAASISSFGVDAAGELYVVNHGGSIHRIDFDGAPSPDSCPLPDPFVSLGGGTCHASTWRSPAWGKDFNADHRSDLLFQSISEELYAWFIDRATMIGGNWLSPSQLNPDVRVTGVNDFSGDGRPDLLLQHRHTGAVWIMIMNGLTAAAVQPIPIAAQTPWQIVASGDINNDGHVDIIWQHASLGQVYVWFMRPNGGFAGYGGDGGAFSGGYVQSAGGAPLTLGSTTRRIVGALDVSGDGRTDLLIQDDAMGDLVVWHLDGLTRTQALPFTPSRTNAAWKIQAVADLNGDQHADLVWQHAGTGDLYVWYLVGSFFVRGEYVTPARVNLIWQIAGPQ